MYRCGNKVEIGDCVTIQVNIGVEEMNAEVGDVAMVLEINKDWSGVKGTPLLTLKLANDEIHQLPSTWCKLCQRK